MVRVPLPPPSHPATPLFHTLPPGVDLFRLFDPTGHNTRATSFRYFGPLLRFDHQRAAHGAPILDVDRGVYYGGFSLSCCLVEVFGDAGMIRCGEWHVAMPRLLRTVRLLDLRGSGAMRAGSVAALSKVPDHSLAQTWSRWFYEKPEYGQPDGLLWYNAHNDEDAFMLYERAADVLDCPTGSVIRLDDVLLRPTLHQIAAANNLIVIP